MTDPEIAAMALIGDALEPLDEGARDRVLKWSNARFGSERLSSPETDPNDGPSTESSAPAEPDSIHELFDSARASTEGERALLAAYWFQGVQRHTDFSSQQLNTELKQMGVGAANITRVLDRLIAKKPALIQQVSKTGTSKQARKRYRLTTAGIREAEALRRAEGDA